MPHTRALIVGVVLICGCERDARQARKPADGANRAKAASSGSRQQNAAAPPVSIPAPPPPPPPAAKPSAQPDTTVVRGPPLRKAPDLRSAAHSKSQPERALATLIRAKLDHRGLLHVGELRVEVFNRLKKALEGTSFTLYDWKAAPPPNHWGTLTVDYSESTLHETGVDVRLQVVLKGEETTSWDDFACQCDAPGSILYTDSAPTPARLRAGCVNTTWAQLPAIHVFDKPIEVSTRWTVDLQGGSRTPVSDGSNLYCAAAKGRGGDYAYCIRPSDGSTLWKAKLGVGTSGPRPVVLAESVICEDQKGVVMLDRKTGERIGHWEWPYFDVSQFLPVTDNDIFVSVGEKITGVRSEAPDGLLRLDLRRKTMDQLSGFRPSLRGLEILGDDIVGYDGDRLYAYHRDGTMAWQWKTDFYRVRCFQPAADHSIYVVGELRNGINDRLDVLSPVDRSLQWSLESSGFTRPAIAGDTVIIRDQDGYVYAMARQDGALRWCTKVIEPGRDTYPPPTVIGESVLVPTGTGLLFALDLGSGKPLWMTRVDMPCGDAPVVVGGDVIISGGDKLYCFRPQVGEEESNGKRPAPPAALPLATARAKSGTGRMPNGPAASPPPPLDEKVRRERVAAGKVALARDYLSRKESRFTLAAQKLLEEVLGQFADTTAAGDARTLLANMPK
jgi:outer membrane protein assembly factor BamB